MINSDFENDFIIKDILEDLISICERHIEAKTSSNIFNPNVDLSSNITTQELDLSSSINQKIELEEDIKSNFNDCINITSVFTS